MAVSVVRCVVEGDGQVQVLIPCRLYREASRSIGGGNGKRRLMRPQSRVKEISCL
jgi:hypothetical protein